MSLQRVDLDSRLGTQFRVSAADDRLVGVFSRDQLRVFQSELFARLAAGEELLDARPYLVEELDADGVVVAWLVWNVVA